MTDASSGAAGASRTVAPHGSWTSPLTAELVAGSAVGLGAVRAAGSDLFWLELRPADAGRSALVRRRADGTIADVTPPGTNVRTLVHEYGGGAYVVFERPGGGVTAIYSEFEDQRLYRLDLDGAAGGAAAADGAANAAPGAAKAAGAVPRPITPEPAAARSVRYADATVGPDGRMLICVRERHEPDGVVNELVVLATDGSTEPRLLAGGHDFYAAPRLSPDGRRLAWLSWDHPRMPWDGTELWVADVTAGGLAAERLVAGGPDESVVQPSWSPGGRLHFVSDRSGWWNLYRAAPDPTAAEALAPAAAEFAGPSWVFGLQDYGFLVDGTIVTFYGQDGAEHLCVLEPTRQAGDEVSPAGDPACLVATPFTTFASIVPFGRHVAAVAGSPTRSMAVVVIDPADGLVTEVRSSRSLEVDPGYLSVPEAIEFPTAYETGLVRGPLVEELAAGPVTSHALYYPPASKDFEGPTGERPPLIVVSHGGPTSATTSALSLAIQFWTSRGIAVVDVDYGGSTGYGRAYRRRLLGNWGIVDTVDCINAARYLAGRGDVDPDRLAIRGGSAGGYTTLNALTRHSVFAAGASYFGLADLEAFAAGGTHKFESQYLVGLVAPYPEEAETYRERSPIHHVDGISCPVILFQGLEDAIVPPVQSEIIAQALEQNGLPYAYIPFEGEQHGFRKAENIARSLEAELYFYGRVFGFAPAGEIEPVEVRNLD